MATPQPEDRFAAYLAALLALYISAEETLLGGVAGILRFTSPDLLSQLGALSKIRRLTARVKNQLAIGDGRYIPGLVEAAVEAGKVSGSREVALVGKDLARGGSGLPPTGNDIALRREPFDFTIQHGVRSVQAIRDDLVSSLDDVKRRITRLPDDIYKVISPAAAAGQAFSHGYTPAQAQAYAWREYMRNGVTGFTDKAGRNWSLSAYVEMSVRTATMRAFNDSHLQVIQATGSNLVIVSSDGHPCPLCQPWENRVLCIIPDGVHPSTADAIAAGLMHCNCKHLWSLFIVGITKLPPQREWSEQDAIDYKNTQKQRRLELEIRKAKRQLEYAIDPATKAAAKADVRRAQARIRQFVSDTGFLRQSRREQVDLANDHLKLPATVS